MANTHLSYLYDSRYLDDCGSDGQHGDNSSMHLGAVYHYILIILGLLFLLPFFFFFIIIIFFFLSLLSTFFLCTKKLTSILHSGRKVMQKTEIDVLGWFPRRLGHTQQHQPTSNNTQHEESTAKMIRDEVFATVSDSPIDNSSRRDEGSILNRTARDEFRTHCTLIGWPFN